MSLNNQVLDEQQFLFGLFKSSEQHLVVRNEFASEVSRQFDRVNSIDNLFVHDVVKHWLRVSVDLYLFVNLFEGNRTVVVNLQNLVVWNGDLHVEMLSDVFVTEQ